MGPVAAAPELYPCVFLPFVSVCPPLHVPVCPPAMSTGRRVVVVRCEGINISGNFYRNKREWGRGMVTGGCNGSPGRRGPPCSVRE